MPKGTAIIELTLDVGRPPPPFLFTPSHIGGYRDRDDMLVGSLDRAICIDAKISRTGRRECSRWIGLIPRLKRGLDLTEPGTTLVNIIIPLLDLSQPQGPLTAEQGIFAYVATSHVAAA